MVGVGTKKADLTSTMDSFCSLLGRDGESWGYSYRGFIQHSGQFKAYSACFKQGSVVGVHLDTWKGTLQFFLDRKPLGEWLEWKERISGAFVCVFYLENIIVLWCIIYNCLYNCTMYQCRLGIAFTGLRGLELYPMVCSTAAKSKMRITQSCSMPASLQMECLSMLNPFQRAYLNAAFPALKYLSQSVFAEVLQRDQGEIVFHFEDCKHTFPSCLCYLNVLDCFRQQRGRRL